MLVTVFFIAPAGAGRNQVLVFEDAEDGTTDRWHSLGPDSGETAVRNLYDPERQSRVIELAGAGPSTEFRLEGTDRSFLQTTHRFILQWSHRFEDRFGIDVYVLEEGEDQPRVIAYVSDNTPPHEEGTIYRHGLGTAAADGTWRTITRDLREDIRSAGGACGEIHSVVRFAVYGNGRVDDIQARQNRPCNQAPVARDDQLHTLMGTPVTSGDLRRNDEDPDGDTFSISSFTQAAQGRVVHEGGGVFTYTPFEAFAGKDRFSYTLTDGRGDDTAEVHVTVTADLEPQPPGSFGEDYEDLIPVDATIEHDPKRFAVLTGLVLDSDDRPLEGVSVTVLGRPGYGTAFTGPDGRFSLPVEGGATLTLHYEKDGWIPSQRQVRTGWNRVETAETVVLLTPDPFSTAVVFDGNPDTVTAHTSSTVSDESGSRAVTMVFTGDTRAFETGPDGRILRELSTLTARATEFPRPDTMPAVLPPNSAYTFCVEMAADDLERVRFSRPVVAWVENFPGFEVGSVVPVGSYDRDRGKWVPEKNGVVVALLDTSGDGRIDALDATGDGLPDDLNADGGCADEIRGLDPSTHWAEQTLWRFEANHFSSWDCNWPCGPPEDATAPNPEGPPVPDTQAPPGRVCPEHINSHVLPRSRVYHDDLPITGTGVTLHYAGNRVPGYRRLITVPVSGDSLPGSLKRIVVRVGVAGKVYERTLEPLPDQGVQIEWDGLDYRGHPAGSRVARVDIGFVYPGQYLFAGAFDRAFGQTGGESTGIETRQEVTLWSPHEVRIASPPRDPDHLADGWTLSCHHRLNAVLPNFLAKGNGDLLDQSTLDLIDTVLEGHRGELTVDPSGEVYLSADHRVVRLLPGGTVEGVAGTGMAGFSGDGGPALSAELSDPRGIAFDAQGTLYIADHGNRRIRRVLPDGTIQTISRDGTAAFRGDGGPAGDAALYSPTRIVADDAGNLYILDGNRVRKIDPAGVITRFAGGGTERGDVLRATDAELLIGSSQGLAVDSKGNVYVAEYYDGTSSWSSWARIRRIDPEGILRTIAGTRGGGYHEEALSAGLGYVNDLFVDAADTLYFSHYYSYDYGYNHGTYNHFLSRLHPDGTLVRVAGKARSPENRYGYKGYSGDGGPATEALLDTPGSLAIAPSGILFFSDNANGCIRRIAPPATFAEVMAAGEIAYADNDRGYVFSSAGDHLETLDLETGLIVRSFQYDDSNRLESVCDRFGNTLTIQRRGQGLPTSLVSPDGQETLLFADEAHHLTRVTHPDGSSHTFFYTEDGLLTLKVDPNGHRFETVYDADGRVTEVRDEVGGEWHFFREPIEDGAVRHDMVTAEGQWTTCLDRWKPSGYASLITGPDGSLTTFSLAPDGLSGAKALACGRAFSFSYGLDPEYRVPYITGRVQSNGALEKIIQTTRTCEDLDGDGGPDRRVETVTTNGRTARRVVDRLSATRTRISSEGRTVTSSYDPETGQLTRIAAPGLHPVLYEHDSRGRVSGVLTGDRQTLFSYDADGWLAAVRDPALRLTTCTRDALGRVTSLFRPDGSAIGFRYDANGNLRVLTNPMEVDHTFRYNRVNLESGYDAPLSGAYVYTYDRDRRLSRVEFPSGRNVRYIYEADRLVRVETPEGDMALSYVSSSLPTSIRFGGEAIDWTWEGSLLSSETLSGTRVLDYAYDDDFRLSALTYAGETLSYGYDGDGLLTSAGGYTISRNALNGLPETVQGQGLELERTFNGYGEIEAEALSVQGRALSTWDLVRGPAGRIVRRTETVNGRRAVLRLRLRSDGEAGLCEPRRPSGGGIPLRRSRPAELGAERGPRHRRPVL